MQLSTLLTLMVIAGWIFLFPSPADSLQEHLVFGLPIGWLYFILRRILGGAIPYSTLLLGGGVFPLVLFSIHRTGRWLSTRWTWRSTAVATFGPLLLVAIVSSSAGVALRISELSQEHGRYEYVGGGWNAPPDFDAPPIQSQEQGGEASVGETPREPEAQSEVTKP